LKVLFLGSTSFEGKPKNKGSRVIPLLKNLSCPELGVGGQISVDLRKSCHQLNGLERASDVTFKAKPSNQKI